MPRPTQLVSNIYTARCGESKNIKGDRDNTLRLWYKLHQKKCSTCKEFPFKKKADDIINTRDKHGLRVVDTIKGDPKLTLKDNYIEKYLKMKDTMPREARELIQLIHQCRRDGTIHNPQIEEEIKKQRALMVDDIVNITKIIEAIERIKEIKRSIH